MKHTEFDKEYYVMNVDGQDMHPTLEWGEIDDTPFLSDQPIDTAELEFPLHIVFDEPYPSKYEMPDFLMLGSGFASTKQVKDIFEKNGIYGIEFFPIEKITDNKKKTINGYFAIHIWNKIPAIDKQNYSGEKPNRKGYIFDLRKFSLDEKFLKSIPLGKRLIFQLQENPSTYIVHESVYELIKSQNLTGFSFFRVDDWDEDAMFR